MNTIVEKYRRHFYILLLITLLLNAILIISVFASDNLFREIRDRDDALYYLYLTLISLGTSNTYAISWEEYFILIFIALSCYLFLGISLFVFFKEPFKKTKQLRHYIKQRKTSRAIHKTAKHKKQQA